MTPSPSAHPVAPGRGHGAFGAGGGVQVVEEGLVDAHEALPGQGGVALRGGRQPAQQLAGGRLDVPPEEQPAVPRQRLPQRVRELGDGAEVDVPDGVAGQHEQVGRVQVGVEAAEDEHLVEHVPVQVPDDALQVVAAGGEGGEVGPVARAARRSAPRAGGCPRAARWSAPGTWCSPGRPGRSSPAARPWPARRAGRPGAPPPGSPARPPSSGRTRRSPHGCASRRRGASSPARGPRRTSGRCPSAAAAGRGGAAP